MWRLMIRMSKTNIFAILHSEDLARIIISLPLKYVYNARFMKKGEVDKKAR